MQKTGTSPALPFYYRIKTHTRATQTISGEKSNWLTVAIRNGSSSWTSRCWLRIGQRCCGWCCWTDPGTCDITSWCADRDHNHCCFLSLLLAIVLVWLELIIIGQFLRVFVFIIIFASPRFLVSSCVNEQNCILALLFRTYEHECFIYYPNNLFAAITRHQYSALEVRFFAVTFEHCTGAKLEIILLRIRQFALRNDTWGGVRPVAKDHIQIRLSRIPWLAFLRWHCSKRTIWKSSKSSPSGEWIFLARLRRVSLVKGDCEPEHYKRWLFAQSTSIELAMRSIRSRGHYPVRRNEQTGAYSSNHSWFGLSFTLDVLFIQCERYLTSCSTYNQ